MMTDKLTKKTGHEQTQSTGSVCRVGGDRPDHDKFPTSCPARAIARGNESSREKWTIVPPRKKSSSIQTTLLSFLPRRNDGQMVDGIRPQPADAPGRHRPKPGVKQKTRAPGPQKTLLQLAEPGKSPFPSQASGDTHNLSIIQINICGLVPKILELTKLLHERAIDVVLLQETLVGKKRSANITGYTAFRCKCADCRGIMSYVRNGMVAKQIPGPRAQGRTDVLSLEIWKNGRKFSVTNVYNPPKHEISLDLPNGNLSRTIIAGDMNAKSPAWGYDATDVSGQKIQEMINSTNLFCSQSKHSEPTLFHTGNGTQSRPDLTFLSADIEAQTSVKVLGDVGSDHRPILITIALSEARGVAQPKIPRK
jgi:Endonuclease-reverse transcriptase